MTAALKAGGAYFAIVFAVAFLLGTARTLVLVPAIGGLAGVLIELPLILAASWVACGWVIGRFRVKASWPDRLAMGGLAFMLLMVAELGLSVLLFGRTVTEYFAGFASGAAMIGLAGQIAFAAVPLLRLRRV